MADIVTKENASKATLISTTISLVGAGAPIAYAGALASNYGQFGMGAVLVVLGALVYMVKAAMYGNSPVDNTQVIDAVKPIVADIVNDIINKKADTSTPAEPVKAAEADKK